MRTIPEQDRRARLREQYVLEKEYAARLKSATPQERRRLYKPLYDAFFGEMPLHAQMATARDTTSRRRAVAAQLAVLKRFVGPETSFLEIGAGDCAVSLEMARHARRVCAIDVSSELVKGIRCPENFELFLAEGCEIPLPDGSIDVAYSYQLMEHLHQDDAEDQLRSIFRTLAPGGTYLCVTPNRLSGPWDISRYFDDVATGLHLKEYTYTELGKLFEAVGFSKVRAYTRAKGLHLLYPRQPLEALERSLSLLPPSIRRRVANTSICDTLLRIYLVGIK